MNKAMTNSLQDKQDREVRVREMTVRAGGSRPPIIDIKESDDTNPPSYIPLVVPATTGAMIANLVPVADEIHADESEAQFEGPRADVI